MAREIEEGWQVLQHTGLVSRVGQSRAGIPKLVEEGMYHGVDGTKPLGRRVFQQPRDQVDGVGVRLTEHLVKGVRLDLGKLVLHVVGIHCTDLVTSWRAQDLDDLHQLIDS